MLTISQKGFFFSLDELTLFMEPDIKQSVIAWAVAGGAKRGKARGLGLSGQNLAEGGPLATVEGH